MSTILFHSISGTVGVRGSERFMMGSTLEGIGLSILSLGGFEQLEPLTRGVQFTRIHGRADTMRDDESLRLAIRHGSDVSFVVGGKSISAFSLLLNTCVDIGNDVLRLLARIHGQCEIHAFVLGEHRAWLAGIIDEGRKWNIMRENMGWEELVTFLRSSSDETVVMSYSVCDSFPNSRCAVRGGWAPKVLDPENDDLGTLFDDLPEHEQWELAMKGLDEKGLRVGPDTIAQGFDTGASAFNLLAELAKR